MASKEIADVTVTEIKKLITTGNPIIGTDRTITGLKKGTIAKVFMSANAPDEARSDIMTYSELSGAEVIILKIRNDELGIICKKPFPVSVLSVPR